MIGHAVIGHAVEWCKGEVVCVCVLVLCIAIILVHVLHEIFIPT